MSVERLLTRLEDVRETGRDKWIAKCPSHDDRSPSLSVRQVNDRLLVHCFAGCDALDIVQSVGLSLSDLFADNPRYYAKSRKPGPDFKSLYLMSQHYGLIMTIFVDDIVAGRTPQPDDVSTFQNAYRQFSKLIKVG